MAPKRSKVTHGSSSSTAALGNFVSPQAKERYDAAKLNRHPIPERGFNFPKRGWRISRDIERRHWDKFCSQPQAAVVPVVREFYANAAEGPEGQVKVRGKMVSFSSESINALLETPVVDETALHGLIENPDYNVILDRLCGPGATWKTTSYFSEKFFQLDPALWYAFLVRRMIPVGHTSDVQRDRAIYLYALATGIPINVGKLIHAQIQMCIANSHIALFFPTIITELCASAGVTFRQDEECLQPMKPIDEGVMKMKLGKRTADRRPMSGPGEGSQGPSQETLQPQPRRRALYEKVDELCAFAVYQNECMAIDAHYKLSIDGVMRDMAIHMGLDISHHQVPPPPRPPFQFRYALPGRPDDEEEMPPPEAEEDDDI